MNTDIVPFSSATSQTPAPHQKALPRQHLWRTIRVAGIAAMLFTIALDSSSQNGSLDASFQAEANASVRAIVFQTNGQIVIGGDFTSVNGVPRNYVARLNNDGDLDRTFDPGSGASAPVRSVAVQSDGKVLIAGEFNTFNGTPRNRIARLNTDGSLDTSFNVGSGANNTVYAVAVQTNGQVLIAGNFTTVNTSNQSRVARLNSDGTLDTSFDASWIGNAVHCLALQQDGRILIGGEFLTIGGTPRPYIARLRADGSLDVSFYPGAGANNSGYYTAVLSFGQNSTGKVVIGGSFSSFDGTSRASIARLDEDGSLDTSFNPGSGAKGSVYSIALQFDSKVIIGGDFTSVNGIARSGMARLNADGTLDNTFSPGLTYNLSGYHPSVFSLAIQQDGKTIIGGDYFTSVNGLARVRIARLNADVVSPAATLSVGMYAGLTITGLTGTTYRVEYTSSLTNQTLWHTLTDVTLSNIPQFFIDTTSPFSARRFYRAVTLP